MTLHPLRQGAILRQPGPLANVPMPARPTNSAAEPTSASNVDQLRVGNSLTVATIVRRERLQAMEQAKDIVERARLEAEQLQRNAQQQVGELFDRTEKEALLRAQEKLAASWIALEKYRRELDLQHLDRSISIGRLLAERLLGETLELQPARITALAREAMRMLWRASYITIHAHPSDVQPLEDNLGSFGVPTDCIKVVEDPSLKRSSLRITSDCGHFDIDLSAQLDRLCSAVSEQLRSSDPDS